jgi:DNA-binding NarL/FixJ family response regulator
MQGPARATVLTAEKSPIVRADVRLILEDAGFNVCADARDGIEAVRLARQYEPDVVLLDLNLSEIDSVEAARLILDDRDVAIVALWSHSDRGLTEQMLRAGATAYLAKPFGEEQLVETIRKAVEARASLEARQQPL